MQSSQSSVDIVDGVLDAMAQCLTPDALLALSQTKLNPAVSERVEYLAAQANEGALTAEEAEQYEQFIDLTHYLTILRLKAKLRLKEAA